MSSFTSDRTNRLDERIILIFPDPAWESLHQIAAGIDSARSSAEVLLDMLARQVWAFYEEGSVYIITRNITLQGEIVSLPRGDYAFQTGTVSETTQFNVTKAFRLGLKVESDWEIVTSQRGLPFPTTRGAIQLLESLVSPGEEPPTLHPTDMSWPEPAIPLGEASPSASPISEISASIPPTDNLILSEQTEASSQQEEVSPNAGPSGSTGDAFDFESFLKQIAGEDKSWEEPVSETPSIHPVQQGEDPFIKITDEIDSKPIFGLEPEPEMEKTIPNRQEEQPSGEPAEFKLDADIDPSKPISALEVPLPTRTEDAPDALVAAAEKSFEQQTATTPEEKEEDRQSQIDLWIAMAKQQSQQATSSTDSAPAAASPVSEPADAGIAPVDIETVSSLSVKPSTIEPAKENQEIDSIIKPFVPASVPEPIVTNGSTDGDAPIKAPADEMPAPFVPELPANEEPIQTEPMVEKDLAVLSESVSPVETNDTTDPKIMEDKPATTGEGEEISPSPEVLADYDPFEQLQGGGLEPIQPLAGIGEGTFPENQEARNESSIPAEPTTVDTPIDPLENVAAETPLASQNEPSTQDDSEQPPAYKMLFDFGDPVEPEMNNAGQTETPPVITDGSDLNRTNDLDWWFSPDSKEREEDVAENREEKKVAQAQPEAEFVPEQDLVQAEVKVPETTVDTGVNSTVPTGRQIGALPLISDRLEAWGPNLFARLRAWEKDETAAHEWGQLAEKLPLRLVWFFPDSNLAKNKWDELVTQTKTRAVLFAEDAVLAKQDGPYSLRFRELWREKYRHSRVELESESTRLRILRSNIEQIEKSFQEYAGYQEELLRLGAKEMISASEPDAASGEANPQRQELINLLIQLQSVEEQLLKGVHSSRDMVELVKSGYLKLQESYLRLLGQVSEKERTSGAPVSVQKPGTPNQGPSWNPALERSRNNFNDQIRAIDRFLQDSYGQYFQNDPLWNYFTNKDIFGLSQSLVFRERALNTRLKSLSNWQMLMESDSNLLEPQIWIGSCNNAQIFEAHNYYPHIIISSMDGDGNRRIEPLTANAWLTAKLVPDQKWNVEPGRVSPPDDPMLLLSVIAEQDENKNLAKIVWDERELAGERGGGLES